MRCRAFIAFVLSLLVSPVSPGETSETIHLSPNQATLTGVQLAKTADETPRLRRWRPNGKATWDVSVTDRGVYRIDVVHDGVRNRIEASVSVAGKVYTSDLRNDTYTLFGIHTFEPGKHELTFALDGRLGLNPGLFSVRGVVLTPVAGGGGESIKKEAFDGSDALCEALKNRKITPKDLKRIFDFQRGVGMFPRPSPDIEDNDDVSDRSREAFLAKLSSTVQTFPLSDGAKNNVYSTNLGPGDMLYHPHDPDFDGPQLFVLTQVPSVIPKFEQEFQVIGFAGRIHWLCPWTTTEDKKGYGELPWIPSRESKALKFVNRAPEMMMRITDVAGFRKLVDSAPSVVGKPSPAALKAPWTSVSASGTGVDGAGNRLTIKKQTIVDLAGGVISIREVSEMTHVDTRLAAHDNTKEEVIRFPLQALSGATGAYEANGTYQVRIYFYVGDKTQEGKTYKHYRAILTFPSREMATAASDWFRSYVQP